MNYNYSIIDIDSLRKDQALVAAETSIFTTISWLQFVMKDQKHITPVMIKICKGDHVIGYFYSFLVNKYGFRILGSPFRGWSTCFMGFNMLQGNDALHLLPSLKNFLFKKYKCHLIEIVDNNIALDRAILHGYKALPSGTLLLDINKSDEELFKVFKVDCRNFIRQFERKGAIVEKTIPSDSFAECFYSQLLDVFAKQNMIPTYSLEKVKLLLQYVDHDNILCLRVMAPDQVTSIASSIFLGYNGTCYIRGGASLRNYQSYRPNEYMIWTAIKYWRNKGFSKFDMVGIRDYKRKFGSYESSYTRIIIPKNSLILILRNFAEKLYFFTCLLKYKLVKIRKSIYNNV